MKKLLLFLSIVTYLSSNAQAPVDGISIFKIGEFTPTKLDSLAASKNFRLLKCAAKECYDIENSKMSLIQFLPEKSFHTIHSELFVDGFSLYKLNGYSINDKYLTKSIKFEFFNNELIEISIEDLIMNLLII